MDGDPVVLDALLVQWRLIERELPSRDLDAPCRLPGWRNRELLAHLAVQPVLLKRFLRTASLELPELTLADNLAGTHSLASAIDATARDDARAGKLGFAAAVDAVRDDLATADLTHSVRSVQGSIGLADYLITRCIEAVVHGMDFNPAMAPEPTAEDLVAEAFIAVLGARAPTLVPQAEQLSRRHWIDAAAGRAVAPRELRNALPRMR